MTPNGVKLYAAYLARRRPSVHVPASPAPSRSNVAGSGTGVSGATAWVKAMPKLSRFAKPEVEARRIFSDTCALVSGVKFCSSDSKKKGGGGDP
jgi:hypothetical protein